MEWSAAHWLGFGSGMGALTGYCCGATPTPVLLQVQFYCGMAAWHIAKGREEKDRQRKAEFFSAAAKHLNSARLVDDKEQLVVMGQGLLHLAKVGVHVLLSTQGRMHFLFGYRPTGDSLPSL